MKILAVTSLALLVSGYVAYDKLYHQPQQNQIEATGMLFQIAHKEGWLNLMEALNDLNSGHGISHRRAEVTASEGNTVFAEGRVHFYSDVQSVCKDVTFSFTKKSLNDYTLMSQQEC
ncbi:hypothetical protein J4N42_19400 [Vibrio sp. SCSIO 43135]|uniref:hypothetical protein n=1 Tax=Vibrio sp. SCSIO 43135 TaxID=2819096 RepID=UPI002074B40D|nr:hypothetical protein [Vibrio sp. SCSIO 43135]USD42786.1 hypothetical protein J4N42_19400 [Vibrio sp. SCSIO 43135]